MTSDLKCHLRASPPSILRGASFLCAALPPLNPLNLLNPPNLFRTQSKGAPPQGLTLNPKPQIIMNYVAIDFETAYWGPANACSLGIVTSNGRTITSEWYHLIRPFYMKFDADCQKVHGIMAEDVEDAPTFQDIFEEIRSRLEGQVVFAHNARFDMGVLASSIATYDLPDLHFTYADTVPLSVKLWPDMENHKLNTVAEALGFDFHHHQALDDARACAYIVRAALTAKALSSPKELLKETGEPLRTFSIDRMKKKLIFK